jgi:glycine cleavage system H protein
MDGFTYTNIFETKGIEYIVIIAFLILIIPFWIILNKPAVIKQKIQESWDILTANLLKIPQGLFFSNNHTWTYLKKSGLASIGIDDFLLKTLGEFKVINLYQSGDKIKKGDIISEIHQNGKLLKIKSPISGEIQEMNDEIIESHELINQNPYESGWFYEIKPLNWVEETNSYYLGDKAKSWIKKEIDRLKDFISISIGKHSTEPSMVTLQEGGELRANPLAELHKETWNDFQEEFLNDL